MIDHISIQVRDPAASAAFYDAVLAPLGGWRVLDFGEVIGYGTAGPTFWIGPLAAGAEFRESHLAFTAPDRAAVQAFFDTAVGLGAEVLHEPRVWPEYHASYFGGFVRDPDGNNVEAVCHGLGTAGSDPKADLRRYLQGAREALLWKLEGLSEYDVRRPLVPTGTNLLGLVKHLATVEAGYFGDTFGRPFGEPLPWLDNTEPNADMWATGEQSREYVVGLYRQVWAHSDATIEELPLDAIGNVPWWPPDRSEVTLHRILVHMIAETHRHAGHADLVRELIDGAVGLRQGNENLPPGDPAWWESYRSRLERVARETGSP